MKRKKKKFNLNLILPNLKQIFEGQSTGFDEHVLSTPVQHWIESISILLYRTSFERSNKNLFSIKENQLTS